MNRTKPLTRRKPLRRSGHSTGKPTKAEASRIVESKLGPCIPCLVWARAGHMPLDDVMPVGDYDHKKSGNVRRGHAFGYCACKWHHQRHPGEGWSFAAMAAHFGPSLMDGSRLFRETYGSDDELIALQSEVIGAAA